jgi:hypothetical protein
MSFNRCLARKFSKSHVSFISFDQEYDNVSRNQLEKYYAILICQKLESGKQLDKKLGAIVFHHLNVAYFLQKYNYYLGTDEYR